MDEELSCNRCGYKCLRKDYMIKHLSRQTPCNPVINDVDIAIQCRSLQKYNRERPNYNHETETYNCNYCDRQYKSSTGKHLHTKKCKKLHEAKTKVKPEKSIDINKTLVILQEQINQLKLSRNTPKEIVLSDYNLFNDIIKAKLNWKKLRLYIFVFTAFNKIYKSRLVIQYVYILQLREFVRLKESVYKIGMTKQRNFQRFNQYPKNSVSYGQWACHDCVSLENAIKSLFKTKYKQRLDYGIEYYEGNIIDMIHDISRLHIES